jgi:hypothetical protein
MRALARGLAHLISLSIGAKMCSMRKDGTTGHLVSL